ncbi:cyclin J isoform X2 [Leptinotarsa decemlineata]|uniref:cyclin J isoform X2 n=1 Tax=Leptinotarsa decemlineata TaxID=7539 RepID=UPI000C254EAC|nr:cyclin-J-like protein isoform X2 [Leptinotarsa decemlineata]
MRNFMTKNSVFYFTYRGHLVEYLKRICIERNLTHCCLHLAVYLLDIFMDNHSIIPERVLLVTNVCLLIAAKFEENNVTIPKISELNAAINNRYPIKEYKNLEIVMLQFFHWYIMFPTAAHYIYYYMQSVISLDDIEDNKNIRTLFFNLHDCITDYLDQIIENVHYMQCYPPSKLAAAIIAASRMDMGLSGWTEELQNLTDYKMEDVQAPTFVLKTKHAFVHCQKCKIENIM